MATITTAPTFDGRLHRTVLVTNDPNAERFSRLVESVNGENIKVDVVHDIVDLDTNELVEAARNAGYSQLLIAVQL